MAITAHRRPRAVRPYSRLAPSYDLAVGVRDFAHTRAWFEALVRRYGIRFNSAADLGCGTGLFAAYLGRCRRIPVFAVDNSPEMLRMAARNCRRAPVCLLRQDIRSLCLPRPVDLVTANTLTLNHFLCPSEMKLAFHRIHQNLRPGGHLMVDLLTHCQPGGGRRVYVQRIPGAAHQMIHEIAWDPRRRLLSLRITHLHRAPSPPLVEVYVGRGYSPLQIGRWLQEAGFRILGIHDAATLRIAGGCPARVVLVARKVEQSEPSPL